MQYAGYWVECAIEQRKLCRYCIRAQDTGHGVVAELSEGSCAGLAPVNITDSSKGVLSGTGCDLPPSYGGVDVCCVPVGAEVSPSDDRSNISRCQRVGCCIRVCMQG